MPRVLDSGPLRLRVVVRGAGEMASGVAHRLARSGLAVLLIEVPAPLAVRRAVSFCEAVYEGVKTVEGLTARLIADPAQAETAWAAGDLPLLVDPELRCLGQIEPQVLVDATLTKRDTGLRRGMAPLTIGLGPGFSAPEQVDLVIETNRGHNLGRLIYQGRAEADTGEPGNIGGHTFARVLRAAADGVLETHLELGRMVEAGQVVATVGGVETRAEVSGLLRGLIRPGTRVAAGLKIGDVDPRGRLEYLDTISDKARALGGSVLEGILAAFNN